MATAPQLFFILHDLRSAYNIGAIFRTADGIGVAKIYLTGYTCAPHDGRRAWETKPERQIGKVALGAQRTVPWEKQEAIVPLLQHLRAAGTYCIALETLPMAQPIARLVLPARRPVALVLGNEPRGLAEDVIAHCDVVARIPMRGAKTSLNVAVAAGVAGYCLYAKMATDAPPPCC